MTVWGPFHVARCLAIAMVALAAACGGPPAPEAAAPVRVAGGRADRHMLEGSWSGEFRDDRTGRTGTIRFTLAPGRDTAYARVLVRGAPAAPSCGDALGGATRPPGDGEFVLRLAQLRVESGSVGGWLTPYRDPEAGCLMDTWFEGLVRRDRIEGAYFARPANGKLIRIGKWEVRRER
jgi:hypothetical protein